ncbi:MAG: DUF2460 domain-containing protein [Brevundimonas sp.]
MWIDQYPPATIMRFAFVSSPRFSTSITAVASGAEKRNQNWAHPLHTFAAPEAVECHEDLAALHNMWMTTRGPLHSFSFRDPLDFASRDLEAADVAPPIGMTDQILGIGDGARTAFQLVRRYEFGGESYDRLIYHPIVDTTVVAINAVRLEDVTVPGSLPPIQFSKTVNRTTGIVTITPAPAEGMVITAGFLFDVEARFEGDDSYDGIVRSWRVSGHADLVFHEVRPC